MDIESKVKHWIVQITSEKKRQIELEDLLRDDLRMDSIELVELAVALEEEFESEFVFEISDDELMKFETVQDVVDSISTKRKKAIDNKQLLC